MKKILLLLLLNIPLLVSSQGISIRTMPVYLGFMYSPDFPYGASNIGVDFHLNEERSIACNFKLRSIDLLSFKTIFAFIFFASIISFGPGAIKIGYLFL